MNAKFGAAICGIMFSVGVFTSCSKEQKLYKGSYSFKTSGTLVLWDQGNTANDTALIRRDTIAATLVSESGQMNVVSKDKNSGRMVVTMNILGGDAVSFQAESGEDGLVLIPKERRVLLRTSDMIERKATLTVGGEGVRYGNVLLFSLDYQGYVDEGEITYKTIGSQVECVAELNEY